MKKSTIYLIIIITLLVIGLGLLIWSIIQINNYPQMKEMQHAAFQTVKIQYWTGIILMTAAWIFSRFKKFFY